MKEDHVSPAQAAKICGVTRKTIYRWLDSGKVPYTKPIPGNEAIVIPRNALPPCKKR